MWRFLAKANWLSIKTISTAPKERLFGFLKFARHQQLEGGLWDVEGFIGFKLNNAG
jgi:hypothetical protein